MLIENSQKIKCVYETAGSLFNGRRIFLLVKLPDTKLVGDKVENYLFFSNSHDGSKALMAGITNIRVVCNNTLQYAIKGAARKWTCKHTPSMEGKKKEAELALFNYLEYSKKLKSIAEELATQKINKDLFLKKLLDNLEKNNYGEKALQGTLERIAIIQNEKDDLANFRNTAWGWYNATADFVSNTEAMRKASTFNENKMAKFMDGYSILEIVQETLAA